MLGMERCKLRGNFAAETEARLTCRHFMLTVESGWLTHWRWRHRGLETLGISGYGMGGRNWFLLGPPGNPQWHCPLTSDRCSGKSPFISQNLVSSSRKMTRVWGIPRGRSSSSVNVVYMLFGMYIVKKKFFSYTVSSHILGLLQFIFGVVKLLILMNSAALWVSLVGDGQWTMIAFSFCEFFASDLLNPFFRKEKKR